MPRTSESTEAKILNFFKTAPLPAAQMLFGLVASEVKSRGPVGVGTVKRTRKTKPEVPNTETAGTATTGG